jgi:Trypsin
MKRRLLITPALIAVLALLVPGSASAVWGGKLDTAHPQVGAMYFDFMDTDQPIIDDLICSGSYAGESKDGQHDVFLTAGHCLPPPGLGIDPGDLFVSFDNNASSNDVSDPVSNSIQVQAYHQMPGFGRDLGDLRDLGVLLLPDDSVPGSTAPVRLPPAGYLDSLKDQGALKFRVVDVVGYGVTPIWDPAGPTSFFFDGKRRAGTSTVVGLTQTFLRLNQNPHGIGTGSGVCFGDSGSPQFDQGTLLVLSVTTGGNGQCNSINYNYRVDTPQARAFLGQFVNLP